MIHNHQSLSALRTRTKPHLAPNRVKYTIDYSYGQIIDRSWDDLSERDHLVLQAIAARAMNKLIAKNVDSLD